MEIDSNMVDICMPDSTVPDAQVMADSHWQPEYIVLDLEDNEEDCGYTGWVDELVGHESEWELDVEEGSDEEIEEIDSESLEKAKRPLLDDILMEKRTEKEWGKAEQGLCGYTGHSKQTKRQHDKTARDRQEK